MACSNGRPGGPASARVPRLLLAVRGSYGSASQRPSMMTSAMLGVNGAVRSLWRGLILGVAGRMLVRPVAGPAEQLKSEFALRNHGAQCLAYDIWSGRLGTKLRPHGKASWAQVPRARSRLNWTMSSFGYSPMLSERTRIITNFSCHKNTEYPPHS